MGDNPGLDVEGREAPEGCAVTGRIPVRRVAWPSLSSPLWGRRLPKRRCGLTPSPYDFAFVVINTYFYICVIYVSEHTRYVYIH